ncbi:protease complex subunit PrcB family protein [Algoriphagus confluentis]|uniref:PrcB C-terminal domain-containing protein n=1 Tax=Algoriphagus confluentis TaxID=1697556 RepID=A0ABQ6PV77_9BACT|nr:hypothetical protein Aconfl_41760 [Algoriphagus confluentis]
MKKVFISFSLAIISIIGLIACAEDEKPGIENSLELMGKGFSDAQGKLIPLNMGVGTNSRQLTFTLLQSGLYTQIDQRSVFRANTQLELEAIWKKHDAGDIILPEVDFETEMVLAVFSGIRSDSGYSLEVTKVWEENGKIIVGIKEKIETGVKLTVITCPNLWIKLPKSNLPMEVYFE